MANKAIITQYYNFIKQAGYKYWNDKLGYYFDNGIVRYSIMKVGPMFQCYHNIKADGNFQLKDKSTTMINFEDAMKWILSSIQKNK